MRTNNSCIPISDVFDLLEKITYNEEKTVDKLLQCTVSDLKGDRSIVNLKALNYFLLFRSNCKGISIYSYENVIYESVDLLKYISDKDITICALLGSVIENCLPLIPMTNINKVFLKLVEFIETNLQFMSGKVIDQADNYTKLAHSLHVLERTCSFKSGNPTDLELPTMLNTTLISLIPNLAIDVARKIFVSVLPKFVLSQDSNIILEQIWLQLTRLNFSENDVSKQLFYLCLLSDNFITVEHNKLCFPLYDKPEFWEIILKGLYNEDSIIRKQSLFLLKLYIEKLAEHNPSIEQDIFYWDNKHKFQLIEFWNKIFTFLEVVEEKQTHLITPALKGFEDLHSLCSVNRKVCYAWLFCVFIRLLKHPSHIIVKWCLIEFCNIDIDTLFHDAKCKELLICFFNALNNMFLFNTEKNSTPNFNHEDLLEKWFTSVAIKDSSRILFEYILDHLASISWGPVPLFYITSAISKIPPKSLFNDNCLNHLKKILLVSLKNQNVYIRSAIQCSLLKCICNLTNSDVDIMTITNILGLFNSKESLKRGTGIWKKCVDWIKSILTCEITAFFRICSNKIFKTNEPQGVETSNSIQSFSRMLVLMTDSEKFPFGEDLKIFIDSIFEQFYECDKRIYSCLKIQDNCLEFCQHIISDCSSFPDQGKKENRLLCLIENRIIDLLHYIEVRLQKGPIENMQMATLYEKTFYKIINNKYLASRSSAKILNLLKITTHSLTLNLSSYHEYLALEIIHHYYKYLVQNDINFNGTFFENDIIHSIFKTRLFGKNFSHLSTTVDPLFNTRGKLMSEIMHTLWSIFTCYLENNSGLQVFLEEFPVSILINAAFNAINEDGKQSLVPILKSFIYLLPLHKNVEDVQKFISITWDSCFELRKTELFWLTISEWMRMVYQDGIALNSHYHQLISGYAVKIMDLGEELTGLVNIFFYHCEKLNFIPQFSAIISKGIVFGAILRKDKRMEMEVSDYIMNLIESGSMESFGSGIILKTDREVRLKVLHLLLTLSNVEHRNHLIVKVIQELISYDEELTKNNNRYFNDSLIHRKKNKLLQAILILENYIYLNPSYQLEAGNERLGSMCSFISIAYHLSVVLNENKFIEQCVEHILPWCMSQNFNIRLYAQILLGKLWNLCPELSTKYHCISKNQWKMYEHEGNMLVNAKKMENDFYFRVFHPINHFTLQTIYWDLPRLSNICVEEWIHPDILRKYSDLCIQNVSEDHNKSLTSCISPVWIIKNSANSDDKIDGTNIQKKFLPTQAMFESHGENINTQKGGLILVASLVDKAANLGGLARTCEVFAAKELVVSNLDVTKEKEFISLSMTAEKHLRISEVKSYNLAEYLKSMKKMGYILIGAEQTTGSVSLTSYHFPEQCVLLLGSEKEGIPPNLLPLLEDYIEIPQLGLVRSLNVHVTGAIFLWEYSKQHSLCNR
ncbi:probable methyltransferase TARBP1 isoform X2 [Halyomorpha halys]|uniref:probable methyltransferase TARBP1 isoform X2 n=1 Tax=Halyomorpha halys TaxID=286706 RepID=UPI0034D341D9